jgi:hypothetical protein
MRCFISIIFPSTSVATERYELPPQPLSRKFARSFFIGIVLVDCIDMFFKLNPPHPKAASPDPRRRDLFLTEQSRSFARIVIEVQPTPSVKPRI